MPHNFIVHGLMPLALGVVSLAFIAFGLYAIFRKRPFVIRARWLLMVLLITLAPSIVMQFAFMLDARRQRYGGSLGLVSFIAPLIMAVIVVFLAMSMRGYFVFLATQESFVMRSLPRSVA